jgi:L-fuculose-phosphate aldolase|tara:strand:- start:16545 stop:17300 length:756 start_codon:yes stop_codon:yes gene_type:complete
VKQEFETPDPTYNWTPGADPKTKSEIETFFCSPEIESLKELMVDLGQRLWQRAYVDGNGGNLSIRVGDDLVLCTPTMISKGHMKTTDMCLVDMEGSQLAGTRARTSEVLTHIGIMKRQPQAKACIHAHPPTATGFAIAGISPPRFLTPEGEVFLGEVGLAPFCRPGSPEMSDVVGEIGKDHTAIMMIHHGIITRAFHLEMAYWRMENLEAHCLSYLAARQALVNASEVIPQVSGDDAEYLTGINDWMTKRR